MIAALVAPSDALSEALAASGSVIGNSVHWEPHSFKGETRYEIKGDAASGEIEASCHDTASALFQKQPINLAETPILRWSWKVTGVHPELKEREKSGDDYPARVYVVYNPTPWMPWRTRAVNYVWSNHQEKGTIWPNAFTGNAMMIALQSGAPEAGGAWREESRNVKEDFKTLFGLELDEIDGIAIMTDCDNAGLPMTGYYKDIRFSRE